MNRVERYFFDGGAYPMECYSRAGWNCGDEESVTPFRLLSSLRGHTHKQPSLSVREAKTGDQQLDKRAIMRRLDAAIEASERSDVEYWFARRLDLSPLTGHARVKLRHLPSAPPQPVRPPIQASPPPLFVPGLSSEVRCRPDGLLYVHRAKYPF